MAAIEELNIQSGVIDDYTRSMFAAAFWFWYQQHPDLEIQLKIWIFPIHVTIKELRPLFELLFGPEPTSLSNG